MDDGGDTGVWEEGEERKMKKGSRNHKSKLLNRNVFSQRLKMFNQNVTEGEEEGNMGLCRVYMGIEQIMGIVSLYARVSIFYQRLMC